MEKRKLEKSNMKLDRKAEAACERPPARWPTQVKTRSEGQSLRELLSPDQVRCHQLPRGLVQFFRFLGVLKSWLP